MRRWAALAIALSVVHVGCGRSVLLPIDDGGGEEPDDDSCPSGVRLGGTCVGASAAGRCHDEPWLAKMSCDVVVTVSNVQELTDELEDAEPGACIDLEAGSYGDVTVPPGVSLLGRGWDCVRLSDLNVASGVIRGVEARSVVVKAVDVVLDEVVLTAAPDQGVSLAVGASAAMRHVSIVAPGSYGISAFDGGHLSLDAVLVRDSSGPAVWVQCGEMPGQCAASRTPLSMRRSQLQGGRIVGLSLVNADAELEDVVIADTTVGANFQAGGNLSIVTSSLEARGLVARRAADFGILVHDSQVTLRATDDGDGIEVAESLRGIWVQGLGSDVAICSATLRDNLGIGIGIDQGATVSVEGTTIRDTQAISLPVLVNGVSAASVEVGDGIVWGGGATATLNRVSVGGSERVPILINGSVGGGSILTDIDLTAGDSAVGIVHQNVFPGAIVPIFGSGVPDPTVTSDELYPVPGL